LIQLPKLGVFLSKFAKVLYSFLLQYLQRAYVLDHHNNIPTWAVRSRRVGQRHTRVSEFFPRRLEACLYLTTLSCDGHFLKCMVEAPRIAGDQEL
jgi:hypothetical protein